LLESEPAGSVAGQCDAFGVWGGFGGEGDKVATGGDARGGIGECLLHVVYGAEGDGVEAESWVEGVDARGPDFGGEMQGADGFAEERCLFALGFGEGNAKRGVEELDGEAGKAGTGAEVEEGGVGWEAWSEVPGSEEAFAEVAADDFFGVADGGEVGAGVPLEEEVEVGGELGVEVRWYGKEVQIGVEEGGDASFRESWHRR
jgi:hypothetical protein